MDYEKKYKDAVNRIKSIIADKKKQGLTNCLFDSDLNEIFPEIKESEDEKIREVFMTYLQRYSYVIEDAGIDAKDAIAWIEKQNKKSHWKPTDEQMRALSMAYKDSLTSGENLMTQTETLKSLYNDLKTLSYESE